MFIFREQEQPLKRLFRPTNHQTTLNGAGFFFSCFIGMDNAY